MKLLELNVSENVIDIDFIDGELWMLLMRESRLYHIDGNGRIIHTVELSMKNTGVSLLDFARIVFQKRYLFLLPYYRKEIYVYDKQNEKTHIILE